VSAILNCESALIPVSNPTQCIEMPVTRCSHSALAKLAAGIIDGHQRMRALVRVHPERNHRGLILAFGRLTH
jgi:hypothetical protein